MSSSFQSQPQQSRFRLQHPPFPVYALYPVSPSHPPYYVMATLPRTNRKPKGPGRPPNAWILYRKYKINHLPPVPPGAPRRAQAEVSKMISNQWKHECYEVKADFERQAEAAKLEHALKYPGYKFAPESKAEKAKRKKEEAAQRELRRAHSKRSRTRQSPHARQAAVAPSPSPSTSYPYDPAAVYGDAGPSPHLSAASSPVSGKSTSLPPLPPLDGRSQFYHSSSPSTPSSDSYQDSLHSGPRSSMTPEVYTGTMPPAITPNRPHPDMIRQHLPHPRQYQPPSQPQQLQMGFVGELTPWMHHSSQDSQINMGPEEFASFQNQWMPPPVQAQGVQQATAFATSDPSVYSLEGGQGFSSFLEGGHGELEVALAPQPHMADPQAAANYAYFASLFDPIDYSQLNDGSSPQAADIGSTVPSRVMSPVEATPVMSFYNDGMESHVPLANIPHQGVMSPVTPSPFMDNMMQGSHISSGAPSPTGPQQQQHHVPSFGQDVFQQYFNFDIQGDMGPLDLNPSSSRSTSGYSQTMPLMQSMPVMDHSSRRTSPTQQVSYIPPAGAAHSGARRVAGSWRPPHPGSDDQSEHSPSGTWTYPIVPARS